MAPYEPKLGRRFHVKTPDGRKELDLVVQMDAIARRNQPHSPKPHLPRNARHGRPRGR